MAHRLRQRSYTGSTGVFHDLRVLHGGHPYSSANDFYRSSFRLNWDGIACREYRHKCTSVTLLNFHFAWIAARRRKVLVGPVVPRPEALLREVAERIACEILYMAIQPDHVHIFVAAPPTLAPDQIMFRLKGYTSRVLRQEFRHLRKMPSLWTRSYFCRTAGMVSSAVIQRYIEGQSGQ